MPKDGDQSTCRNCNEDIEYDSGNEPAWTHSSTGVANCDEAEDSEDYEGCYAEPDGAPLAPPTNGKYEVLVYGDPFDGLTIEGPYPQGFLENENVTDASEHTCWVVPLASPTIPNS
jgi:hypothetical protein